MERSMSVSNLASSSPKECKMDTSDFIVSRDDHLATERQTMLYEGVLRDTRSKVIWDVFIVSDDMHWRNKVLNEVKIHRSNLRYTIKDTCYTMSLLATIHRSKKVVIGFTTNPKDCKSEYVTAYIIDHMLQENELIKRRLIPVKLSEDVEIPPSCDPFQEINDWEEDAIPQVLEALSDCRNIDAPCEGELKKIVLNNVGTKRVRKKLRREWSVDVIDFEQAHEQSIKISNNDIEPLSSDSYKKEIDVFIVSSDCEWENKVCVNLKERRENLNVICRNELISNISTNKTRKIAAKKVLETLLQPLRSATKVIVGFASTKRVNSYLEHIIQAVLDKQGEQGGDYGGLIPVLINRDAVVPSVVPQFRLLKSFDDKFHDDLWEAVNGIKYDCYVVSCNNAWEEAVSSVLRDNNLKVICRKDIIPDLSTEQNKTTTMYYGGISNALSQQVPNTKKTIVGFDSKNNGFLIHISGLVIDKHIKKEKEDIFGGLIPVMMNSNTIIPYPVNRYPSLKCFHKTFYEDVLNAVTEINVQVKVICQRRSEKYEKIVKVIRKHVEKFPDSDNPVRAKIRKYLANIGLKFKGITVGSIIFHLSANDPVALQRLTSCIERKNIMKVLAKMLFPRDLQEAFCQEWSINIDKKKYDAAILELETHTRKPSVPAEVKKRKVRKTSTHAEPKQKRPKLCKPSK